MTRYYITIVAFLLFFAVSADAQYMQGNVVVHSDPRLALLLKKNPTAAPPITPISNPEERLKRGNKTPKPASVTKPAAIKEVAKAKVHQASAPTPAGPTNAVSPVNPTTPIQALAANMPKKINGTTAHQFIVQPAHKDGRVIYSGKGYRVQIYYGNDREKAIKVRTEFMRLYPGMKTYLSYLAPSFRVKVGDYRNRSDATGMLKEANSMYSPSMIVPDDVTVYAN